MLVLIATSIFVAVALLTTALLLPILTKRSVIQERLAKLAPQTDDSAPATTLIAQQTPLENMLARLGQRLPVSKRDQSKYAKALTAAGLRKQWVLAFIGCKIVLAVAFPTVYMVFYSLPHRMTMNSQLFLYTVGLAILGFLLPTVWLSRRVENRKREIFHTLPDILDLLCVCVDAGLGIDAAIIKTSESPQFIGNPLAEEFKLAAMEIRAGKPRAEALKDMGERTMVEDVRAFVAMLIQSERFGTGMGQALRVHSESLRTKRRQIAEESAAKTTIKMLFPLVFFIFPALFVVILGPAVFLVKTLLH